MLTDFNIPDRPASTSLLGVAIPIDQPVLAIGAYPMYLASPL